MQSIWANALLQAGTEIDSVLRLWATALGAVAFIFAVFWHTYDNKRDIPLINSEK